MASKEAQAKTGHQRLADRKHVEKAVMVRLRNNEAVATARGLPT